jgi:ubiquinol-cytochrome c reductase iron-sulfur subunit
MAEATEERITRREFLKLMAAAGTVMAFTPFIDWGKFMPRQASGNIEKIKVELPDGSIANVKKFPPNSAETIIYPKTGDRVLDQEPFRVWRLIRLPEEMGGNRNDASAFRCYSAVCLHLWCLWKYRSEEDKKRGECPCHGSIYDARTGKAIDGPASFQSPPANLLPMLELEVDANGDLWILPPTWDLYKNGIIGFGRFAKGINA